MPKIVNFVVSASVALTMACPAHAVEMPKRKPGLWELKATTSTDPKPDVMQHCIDEQTDDLLRNFAAGMEKEACTKNEVRKEGGKYLTESVCKFFGSTITSRGEFTGDFTSSYRGEFKSSYDPPMMGMKEDTTWLEAKWLGPCKPGQKPGAVSMPGKGAR